MPILLSAICLACSSLSFLDVEGVDAKADVKVEFCGRLRHGVAAIGGETTGTTVSFNRIIWEVQLQTDAEREFAKTHHKKTVLVSGSLRKVSGVERKERWIIDVRKLEESDAPKDKQGVRLTITGKLQTATAPGGAAGKLSVVASNQTWPVITSDAKVKTAAQSLLGQSVQITGGLRQSPATKSKAIPTIQISTLGKYPCESTKEAKTSK